MMLVEMAVVEVRMVHGIGGGRGGPEVVEEVAFGCFCLYYSSKSQVS